MPIKKLSSMKNGDKGTVVKVNGTGNIKFRLIDMGVIPGAKVQVVKYAPLGDPIEIKVKGFSLSLRVDEADMIDIAISKGE